MATGPLMHIYKPNIAPSNKYGQMKATFYTYNLYRKVPSLLGNKLAQVFNSRNFIFVVPMNSKKDGVIGRIHICDEHGITEELIYDNSKEESMPGTTMKIITRKFYIIGISSETYTQQHNNCEGNIMEL